MGRRRDDPALVQRRQLSDTEHERDVRPVDVGVEQADGRAGAGQRDGQIDADRRLADPALAAADRDDRLRAGLSLEGRLEGLAELERVFPGE